MKKKSRMKRGEAGSHEKAQPARVQVVIETPRGSRNKFKFDPKSKAFKLSKVMPEGMVFPYDFGYIPATKGGDGDPLDVLVLTDEPLFVGCLLDCRLIGVIEAEQEEKGNLHRNDRLIAVAVQSLLFSEVHSLDELSPVVLKQVQDFFVNYQQVRNVKVKILGHHGPERGAEILRHGES